MSTKCSVLYWDSNNPPEDEYPGDYSGVEYMPRYCHIAWDYKHDGLHIEVGPNDGDYMSVSNIVDLTPEMSHLLYLELKGRYA